MTLQDLCLTTIRNSLDRFCYAYSITNSDDLRLGVQFLQKVHSSELVSWFDKDEPDNLLPDNYADFAFSKYLKSLNTRCFLQFSWKAIFDTFARIGPSLENVVFSEDARQLESLPYVEDCNWAQWKNTITFLPNVKAITYRLYCKDDILECIAKCCPRLETLNVIHSLNVTDDGLKYFYQKKHGKVRCPFLKKIFVASTSVNDSIKHLLKKLPLLERIDIYNLPYILFVMHKDDLDSLDLDYVKKYNLKHMNILRAVDISHTEEYDGVLEICVTLCPKLKSLYCPLYKSRHSDLCCLLTNVEDLHLDCVNSISVEVNDVLIKMGEKLTSLTLCNCSVSLSVLGQYCHHLNHLTLHKVNIEYNDNDPCRMFSNLEILTIKKIDLSDPGYSKAISRILASSPTIENLYLKKCKSFSSGLKAEILKCCKQYALKLIYFQRCSLEAHFIMNILLTCSTLETFKSDLCDMYSDVGKDLYSTAKKLPNTPDVTFCSEYNGNNYFTDTSSDSDDASVDYDVSIEYYDGVY